MSKCLFLCEHLIFMYRHTCFKIIKYCVWLLLVPQPYFNILTNVITYLNKQKRTIGYFLSTNPSMYCYCFVIRVTTKLNWSDEKALGYWISLVRGEKHVCIYACLRNYKAMNAYNKNIFLDERSYWNKIDGNDFPNISKMY